MACMSTCPVGVLQRSLDLLRPPKYQNDPQLPGRCKGKPLDFCLPGAQFDRQGQVRVRSDEMSRMLVLQIFGSRLTVRAHTAGLTIHDYLSVALLLLWSAVEKP